LVVALSVRITLPWKPKAGGEVTIIGSSMDVGDGSHSRTGEIGLVTEVCGCAVSEPECYAMVRVDGMARALAYRFRDIMPAPSAQMVCWKEWR
jgi:hypothetical protein